MGEKERAVFDENRLGILGNILPWMLKIQDNPERWAFVLHRLTGIYITLYFLAHVYVTSQTPYPNAWTAFLRFTEGNPLITFGEWILFGSIVFHGLNCIRLILSEALALGIGRPKRPVYPYVMGSLSGWQRRSLYVIFAVTTILWVAGGIILFHEAGWF